MSIPNEPYSTWREKLREQEQRAFATNKFTGEVSDAGWKYQLDIGKESQSLERILEVIKIVITHDREQWPLDEEWERLLPKWFNDATPLISEKAAADMLAAIPRDRWHELPWDFGSWLDAIQEREWMWYGYEEHFPYVTIYLKLSGWPANLGTLEHFFKSAGAQIVANEKM